MCEPSTLSHDETNPSWQTTTIAVGGLPTLIRFDGGDISKEAQRIEGALTKDQIIDFVNGNFNR